MRSASPPAGLLAPPPARARFGVPALYGQAALLELRPHAVLEAAFARSRPEHLVPLLDAGIGVIVCPPAPWPTRRCNARRSVPPSAPGRPLHVPSGGIGGSMPSRRLPRRRGRGFDQVAKPPRAWKGIAFVERLGVDLDALRTPLVLYDGLRARACRISRRT